MKKSTSNAADHNTEYPVMTSLIPTHEIESGGYTIRFARNTEDLDRTLRLRYEVFNLELGEGLESSHLTKRDEDKFDPYYHHLMVLETATNRLIGTYRMQTKEMADRCIGFYTDGEFHIGQLPKQIINTGVELGRACIHKDFRSRNVLFNLWEGLCLYLLHNKKRYFFGCVSLTSQDPEEGRKTFAFLRAKDFVRNDFTVEPRDDFRCFEGVPDGKEDKNMVLPPLFNLYLLYKAKVCGVPAIDRTFKTIDFLILLDLEAVDDRKKSRFLKNIPGAVN